MISVSLKHNLNSISKIIDAVGEAGRRAAVQTINRTALSMRAEGARIIAKRINLPIGGRSSKGGGGRTPPGIKSMIEIGKAKYRRNINLSDVFATIRASPKPISLIHFIRGSKDPAPQKGIKIKDRKILKAMVTKGRTVKLAKAFIARSSRGGATQVFRRKSQGSYHKQSVPSLYHFMSKPEIQNALRGVALKRLAIEYPRQLAFYTNRIVRPRK